MEPAKSEQTHDASHRRPDTKYKKISRPKRALTKASLRARAQIGGLSKEAAHDRQYSETENSSECFRVQYTRSRPPPGGGDTHQFLALPKNMNCFSHHSVTKCIGQSITSYINISAEVCYRHTMALIYTNQENLSMRTWSILSKHVISSKMHFGSIPRSHLHCSETLPGCCFTGLSTPSSKELNVLVFQHFIIVAVTIAVVTAGRNAGVPPASSRPAPTISQPGAAATAAAQARTPSAPLGAGREQRHEQAIDCLRRRLQG